MHDPSPEQPDLLGFLDCRTCYGYAESPSCLTGKDPLAFRSSSIRKANVFLLDTIELYEFNSGRIRDGFPSMNPRLGGGYHGACQFVSIWIGKGDFTRWLFEGMPNSSFLHGLAYGFKAIKAPQKLPVKFAPYLMR